MLSTNLSMGFYFIKPWSFSLKAAVLVLLFLVLLPLLDRCMTFFSLTSWWSDTFDWTSLKGKKIRIAIKCITYIYCSNIMMIFVTAMKTLLLQYFQNNYLAHVIEQPNFRIPNPQYLQRNFCFDFFNDSENTFWGFFEI